MSGQNEWPAPTIWMDRFQPLCHSSRFRVTEESLTGFCYIMYSHLWPGKEWQSTLNDSSNLTACNGEGAVLKEPIRRLLLKKEGGIAAQAKTTHSTYRVIWNIMQQLRLYYYFMERCLWYSVDYKQQNGKLYCSSALENI